MSDSGFITTPLQTADGTDFHDFQQIAVTSHAILTSARRDGRRWMLKSLPSPLREDPFHLSIQQKEYTILSGLNHPAIVGVYERMDIPTLGPTIVMEYVDGDTLDKVKLTKAQRRKVAYELAKAVAYIHACQVVHRDLKPTNIMVTRNGHNVKLIDFGLADTDAHTILKQPAGTEEYVSAEQRTSSRPDVRNDIYSLGLILKGLKPGWPYRSLIHSMLLPIDKRTQSMAEVLQRMERSERKPVLMWLLLAFLLCLTFAVTAIWLGSRHEETPTTVTQRNDTVFVKPLDTARPDTTYKPISQKPSAATSVPVATAPTTAKSQTKTDQQGDYDQLLEQGKARVDDLMQRNHFEQMADTVTSSSTLNHLLGPLMGKASTLVSNYAAEHSADESTRQQMKRQLDEYTLSKYWIPNFTRLTAKKK